MLRLGLGLGLGWDGRVIGRERVHDVGDWVRLWNMVGLGWAVDVGERAVGKLVGEFVVRVEDCYIGMVCGMYGKCLWCVREKGGIGTGECWRLVYKIHGQRGRVGSGVGKH